MHPGPISGVQIVRQLLWNNASMKWLLRFLFFGVCMVVSSELTLWGYGPWHQFYHLVLLWLYLQTQREMDHSHQHRAKAPPLSLETLAPFLEPLLRKKQSATEDTSEFNHPPTNNNLIVEQDDEEGSNNSLPDVCAICWESLDQDPDPTVVINEEQQQQQSAYLSSSPKSSISSSSQHAAWIPEQRHSLYVTPWVIDHAPQNKHGFHFQCLLRYAQTRIRPGPFRANEPQALNCPVCRDPLVHIRPVESSVLGRTTNSTNSMTGRTRTEEDNNESETSSQAVRRRDEASVASPVAQEEE